MRNNKHFNAVESGKESIVSLSLDIILLIHAIADTEQTPNSVQHKQDCSELRSEQCHYDRLASSFSLDLPTLKCKLCFANEIAHSNWCWMKHTDNTKKWWHFSFFDVIIPPLNHRTGITENIVLAMVLINYTPHTKTTPPPPSRPQRYNTRAIAFPCKHSM